MEKKDSCSRPHVVGLRLVVVVVVVKHLTGHRLYFRICGHVIIES